MSTNAIVTTIPMACADCGAIHSNEQLERTGGKCPAQADCDEMNCQCGGPIHEVMGVERCQVCGKLAGRHVMRPYGAQLPSKRRARARRAGGR